MTRRKWVNRLVFGVVILQLFLNCALSPGRRMLDAGDKSLGISIGGAWVDNFTIPLAIPINVGFNFTYGISKDIGISAAIYPIGLLSKCIVSDISIVGSVLKAGNNNYEVNAIFTLPAIIDLNSKKHRLLPTLGLCPVLIEDNRRFYPVAEIRYDLLGSTEGRRLHLSARVGAEFELTKYRYGGLEVGLNQIGESSSASALSRLGIGVPVYCGGLSYVKKGN